MDLDLEKLMKFMKKTENKRYWATTTMAAEELMQVYAYIGILEGFDSGKAHDYVKSMEELLDNAYENGKNESGSYDEGYTDGYDDGCDMNGD